MVLTTSYQKVKETKMGSWGYGTLYLRTYAKINSQSIGNNQSSVSIQSRVYNNGSWCESGNCYNTLMGTKVKNNVWLTFESGEITLGTVTSTYTHNIDGSKSISLTNTFKCYALGSTTFNANTTVELPKINRMDKATGLDFDIGSSTLVTITRYNSAYTRSVVASIGTYQETLMEKGTDTQIGWQPDADTLYEQVPNSNIGTITLTTTTYSGDTVIGTQTSTLKCRVTESNPTISAVIITDNLSIVSENTLVRYLSIPKFEIRALPQNYATITSYSIAELNSTEMSSSENVIILQNTVKNNSFTVKVTDSRGNSSTTTITASDFIEYNLPAISKLDLIRVGENLNEIQASINGIWYNKEINGIMNTASLKYRYKTSDTEYSEYIDIPEEITQEQFYIDTLFNPSDGFDVNSIYTIEVVITDNLTSGNLTGVIGKAIPLTDHWNDGEKDYYNINAEIQQYGKPITEKDLIMLRTYGDYTINATNTVETIPFELEEVKRGSKLTVSNGKVVIGSRVSLIKLSLNLSWTPKTAGMKYAYVYKNGANNKSVDSYFATVNNRTLISMADFYLPVTEGDIISVPCYGVAGDIINGTRSHLSIEVVE